MALATARKKVAQARKDHEKQLRIVGKGMRTAIVDMIAGALPEGWAMTWHQSDNQYDDQDYYFGLDCRFIVSEREPRQGEQLTEGRPRKSQSKTDHSFGYPRTYEEVTDYGEEPTYEWHLDAKCPKRKWDSIDISWGEPGVLEIDEQEVGYGLTKKDLKDLWEVFEELDDDDFRLAFGDSAYVRVHSNRKVVINDDEE